MHLLDLVHSLAGPLPLHSALLRTQFWDAPVEDNAALLLGADGGRADPWAMLHVSWTEWKNLFSLEIYCRTAKLHVEGLVRSYGPQTLRIYRMRPELGPPDLEEVVSDGVDRSWELEWDNFRSAIAAGDPDAILGGLGDARYAWGIIEAAYERSGW
jgi:predicted dehydrogenase